MNRYKGTYLSQLPSDLIKELDKYQNFIILNEKFKEYGHKLAKLISDYIRGYGFNQRAIDMRNGWNTYFQQHNITSRFEIGVPGWFTNSNIIFVENGLQNVSIDVLDKMKNYITILSKYPIPVM